MTRSGSETSSKLDRTIATDQALAGLPQAQTDPTPAAPASPPAGTYLSGIVTAGLAAICGAVFTSWAGVQGTLVGAMIGATIGSSVSEIARAPLDALERRLIAAGISARRLRRDGVVKTVATSPTAAQQAFGMISRGAIVTVGATAVVGFLLAVGGVTAVEVATGEPLAAMVADEPARGTTVGNVVQNAPPALAPAASRPTSPGAPTSGRSGGGVTSSRPADPILGAEDPMIAGSPTPTAASTTSNEAQNTNTAASPDALASPDATAQDATPGPATPTATVSGTATSDGSATPTGPTVVQVVTVVVTATPTSSPTLATPGAGGSASAPATTAPAPAQTSTPTPSRTPTPTPTSTPTSAAVTVPSAPTTSPPAPAPQI